MKKPKLIMEGIGGNKNGEVVARLKANLTEMRKSIAKSAANIKGAIVKELEKINISKAKNDKPESHAAKGSSKAVDEKEKTKAKQILCPQSVVKLCNVDKELAETLIR